MSFELQDELGALSGESGPDIANEINLSSLDPSEISATANHALEAVTTLPESICDETTFDTFRSLLKYHEALPSAVFSRLVDSIASSFAAQTDIILVDADADLEVYRSHRHPLEHYAYLLYWSVSVAGRASSGLADSAPVADARPTVKGRSKAKATTAKGKAKAPETGSWADSALTVLNAMSKALRLRTDRIWTTTQDRDNFVGCLVRAANMLAESETLIRMVVIRHGIADLFTVAAKSHGQAYNIRITVLQDLQYFEHLAEPMAEIVAQAASQHDFPELADEVLREIAGKTFSAQDTKGPRSFSRFIVALADAAPRLVAKQIALLQKHLDSEAHTMRMAIIDVVGILIIALSSGPNANQDADPAVLARQLEAFFALVSDRFLDVNAFVRAKAISVSIKICDVPAKFPRLRLELCRRAVRSLGDKSSSARKNCIALLCKLVQTHPYGIIHGGTLSQKEWQGWYEKVAQALEPLETVPDIAEAGVEEPDADGTGQHGDGKPTAAELEEGGPAGDGQATAPHGQLDNSEADDQVDLAALTDPNELKSLDADQITLLRLQKRYYGDALSFIATIGKAVPLIADLLTSKVKSEALEAMDFFCVAHEYNIQDAEVGIKRMLHLIWAKDNSTVEDGKEVKGVRSRVIECYRKLFLDPLADLSLEDNIARTTRNMIGLTEGATLAELTSLEQLMSILMANDNIEQGVIDKLWEVYSSSRDIARNQRRGAIMLLGMLAAAKSRIASENTDMLLQVGLGPFGKADLVLAKYSCLALRRIGGSQKKVKGSLTDASVRLPMSSPIFDRLRYLIEMPTQNKDWFGMAEQAINTIFVLGEQPDYLASSILQTMTRRVFERKAAPSPPDISSPPIDQADVDDVGDCSSSHLPPSNTPETPTEPPASACELAQLIFAAGHCAIKQLIHLELVEREYKRRKAEADKSAAGDKATANDELDQVAGSVEDDVADAIIHAREDELLYGVHSILSVFAPMSAQICSQPKSYKNETLRTAAVLSMAKFMCVSAKFCEAHLMLLFKILETATNPVIRSNIVIALGDIAVCFSNIMDENSDRLYLGLRDGDLTVKKNTLMVLTHLILNGMIKVKGQLGEMARCIVDDQVRISDLSKLFFEELASKDNAIYNNLPDIISHLSLSDHAVSEIDFSAIVEHIFKYIDKEKQAEQIIEKLCQRFKLAGNDERQWRDIALCLSMLPYKSERSITKLVEALPEYQDKLYEPVVYSRFQEVLTKARANKVGTRSEVFEAKLKEFEEAMDAAKARGEEDQIIQKRVEKKRKTAKTTKRTRKRQASTPPSSP